MDKATFLARATTFKRVAVEVENVGTVYVRELSVAEARQYMGIVQKEKDETHALAWLAVHVLCDEDGRPILTEQDAETVKQMPMRVLNQIAETSAALGGAKKPGEAQKKESGTSPTPG